MSTHCMSSAGMCCPEGDNCNPPDLVVVPLLVYRGRLVSRGEEIGLAVDVRQGRKR